MGDLDDNYSDCNEKATEDIFPPRGYKLVGRFKNALGHIIPERSVPDNEASHMESCQCCQAFLKMETECDTALAENALLRNALTHYSNLPYGGNAEAVIALEAVGHKPRIGEGARCRVCTNKTVTFNHPSGGFLCQECHDKDPTLILPDRSGISQDGHAMAGKRVFSRKGYLPNGLFNDARTGKADRRKP